MKSSVQHYNAVERPRQPSGAAVPATQPGHFSPAHRGRDVRQYAAWAVIALSVAAPLLAYCVRAASDPQTAERPDLPPTAPAVRTPTPASAPAQAVLPDAPPTQDLAGGAAAAAVPSGVATPAEWPHPAPPSGRAAGPPQRPCGGQRDDPKRQRQDTVDHFEEHRDADVRAESLRTAPPGAHSPPAPGSLATGGAVALPSRWLRATFPPQDRGWSALCRPGAGAASPAGAVDRRGRADGQGPTADTGPSRAAATGGGRQTGGGRGRQRDRPAAADAWGLIDRGDYEPARTRLEKARKRSHDDMRADFSLGLLTRWSWGLARGRERFEAGLRRDPKCVAVLNNLAIAELHDRRPTDAMKALEGDLDQDAATADVVQNLGRVRHLLKEGRCPERRGDQGGRRTVREAAIAAAATWQSQVGFRVMPLPCLTDRTSASPSMPGG